MRKTQPKSGPNYRAWLLIATVAALLVAALASGPARGQAPAAQPVAIVSPPVSPDARPLQIDLGATGLMQTLRKLRTRASVLMIVAHPDDEDSGMLTYESRGQGARAMMLTLNRGEGGQNVMSDDFESALGLLRTQELLSADRYSGVEQYFGGVVDFGFAKTREEALNTWGHDRVLADVVRVVRMTRPLVIASTFVGGTTDGHGHHQVAGQMAQEVFDAAGDPNMFPEQIRAGLRPWSPAKMYARAQNRAANTRYYSYIEKKWIDGPLAIDVTIPEGDYDSVLGATYFQVAREGLALQKSQNGGGRVPLPGPNPVPYHRFASRVTAAEKEKSYFDGVDISLAGGIASLVPVGEDVGFLRAGLAGIQLSADRAIAEFSPTQPAKIDSLLTQGLKDTNALAARVASSSLSEQAKYDVLFELREKQKQFQQAIAQALGVSLSANVGAAVAAGPGRGGLQPADSLPYVVPGQDFAVTVHLNNPGDAPLELKRIWIETPAGENWIAAPDGAVPARLNPGQALDQRFHIHVPDNAAPSRPYFSRPSDAQPYYDISDTRYQNLPLPPYPVSAWTEFTEDGVEVRTGQVAQTAKQVTGMGTVTNPLMVAPAVSVFISSQAGITPLGSKSFTLTTTVHTEKESGANGNVHLALPASWHSEPATAPFALERAGFDQTIRFQVFPDRLEQKRYSITAIAESGGRPYQEGFTTVGYSGLRPYNLYAPATYRTTGVNVKMTTGLRIGYVTGTGDAVPESLKEMGLQTEFVSAQDLIQGDLQKYNAIVLGIRANDARPELETHSARLLDYVNNGGVLVVQYHYGRGFGPYPYTLPGAPGADTERVVDETAPVTFLNAQSPLLNWPNKISQEDFAGWIAGRGNGFLLTWDDRYQAVLETHDPGQMPQKGGLVYARYGRGVFVYTALSLYRQLPEGVPGPFRLFANLLSLQRNPAFQLPALRGGPVRPATPQR